MKLGSLLDESTILVNLPGGDKETLLARLVGILPCAREPALRALILERVLSREAEEATGMGLGIALPHATAPVGPRVFCALGITRDPAPFRSPDSRPVHCVFLAVGGEEHYQAVIMALSVASRLLREDSVRRTLRATATADEAIAYIRHLEKEEIR